MGTRDDPSLTARERAALAHLEARAAADDPQLAHRLRGRPRPAINLRLPTVPTWTGSPWWSAPLVVVGLVLAVLGLSVWLALSVVGCLILGGGLWMLAGAAETRLRGRATPP